MKTQFKRFSKSTISVLLAVCLLFSCMTVGIIATSAAQDNSEKVAAVDDSEAVGTTVPSGTTFYLDVTNFSGTYNDKYYLSLSGNSTTTATSSNTSGAASYVPKKDNSWVEMTKVRGNIYSATTTAQNTNGRVSFWSKNESGYDNVWEVNVSLGNAYTSGKTLFTISSGSSTHSDRRAVCFSGTWSTYNPDNYAYSCPSSVLNGTDIMFYIKGYSGDNVLTNGSGRTKQTGATFTTVDSGSGYAYVQAPKSGVGSYQYITNNPSGWNGNINSNIGTSSAGNLHQADATTSTTAAKTATSSLSSSSITTGTASITVSTTCNSSTGVYNSLPLYYQYYLNDTYVSGSEKSASTSAQSFTLDTSSLAAGSYTLKTVATDGNIFYIADTDTFTISDAAQTFDNIGVAAKYSTTGASNSYTNNMVSGSATISATSYTTGTSALTITANSVTGYTFAQWVVTAGSGTIGSTTSASTTFVPGEGGTTVTAQYKKNYTISDGTTDTHGTVSLSDTSRVAGQSYTATVTPADGYKITSLTVGGSAVSAAAGKTSYTYNGTAQGSNATISVVATFEVNTNMKFYIAGRFRVRPSAGSSSWTTTYASGSDWNATSTSIPFTYVSGTTYKVDTYATLAELSAKIGSSSYTGDPVFFVYDKTETTAKNWYASSATTMSTTGTTLVSSGGSNSNLKFSSTSTDGPVTVYYDSNTHKIWYGIPDLYDVTCSTATGGSVSASPSRCEAGTTVTLTIAPSTGYQLSGVTTSPNVTLSGTGNTRTFTMPASNVTVTPSFTKINYNLNKVAATNGSFKLTNNSGTEISTAQYQDTVKIVPTANTGYEVDKVYWGTTNNPTTEIAASSGTYSVSMPAGARYFKVTFKAINYTITSTKTGNGTVTVKKSGASSATSTYNIGDTLVITATPSDYNQLTNIVVSGAVSGTYTSSPVTLDMTGKTGALTITTTFAATTYTGLYTQAKYSTTGASGSYDNPMTYVPTISSTSGTNATGVTVTADATKVEGGYTYQFVNWSCDSGDGTFTSATSASTTFKPKKDGALAIALYKRVYKTTATTNKSSWGTVSVDKEYAVYNETVTITCTPAAGIIKTIVAYDTTNSRVVKSWKRNSSGSIVVDQAQQNSANQFTQVGLSGIAGSIYSFIKDAGEALGAADDSTAVGDDPLTFNMPAGAVSVTATYEEYVGTSEYIYHGRNTSGQAVSGYENEVMSEGVINGQKYAYYNVSGRGSVGYDQLFYVSKGGSYTDRWVYFNAKGETYGDWYEPYGTNVHAYFYNSSGAVGTAWPGATMTWVSDGNDNDKDSQWKIAIPSGATGVIFSNGKSGGDFKQTQDIDLTNTNGSYYPSGYSNNKYTVTQWTTPGTNSGIIAGTDYYWDTDVYKDQWYTGGFSNHNVNNDHNYAKPKDGNSQSFNECKDDYYIILLYPNTSYTFGLNGHDAETKTTGSKPWVLWSKELPGQSSVDVPTVKVYAKDGTIRRDGDDPERNDRTYSYFEQHANTFVYSDSGYANHIGVRSSHDGQSSEGTGYNGYTYDYVNKFNKGDTLYIKTNLDSTLKEKYYLAAYCINGKTYELHTPEESATGSVTEKFTVPEDWEDKYVEITPIYFLKDTAGTKMITFYIEGYDEEVMNAGWGNTPFVYPFYQDANFNYVSNINNAFGGYPGQPMVFYKGNYYIQLPDKITTTISTGQTGTATIKGVTLGNGYWDDIHLITGEVKSHFQTYDYDDLYKIYTEYPDQADHIICSFKYKTKKNNDEPASMTSSIAANYNTTNGNGWEVLTNYYGEPVDVFGNVLTDSAKTLAEDIMAGRKSADTEAVVHAISQDYKSNSAGDYATEWVIYNTSGTKVVATSGGKTSIVPSALAINANTGSGELTANFDKYDNATKAFKSIYTALYKDTNVRNKPAVVTYEKSIYGGGDKADRCDARWYFSKKGKTISATTRIEYTDDGKTWNTDTYNTNTGTGSYTGAQAYFTGTATTATDTPTSEVSGKNTTTLDGTVGGGYYTFSAEGITGGTNGNYEFVGWYLLRDNYQNISSRSDYGAVSEFPSHAEMTKNGDIFVARFKKTATGTFDIFHEIHPQTSGYGTVDVSAVVKNGDTVLQTYSSTGSGTSSHIQIGSDYIRSGAGNTIVATFTAAPYHTSNFDAFYATVQDLLEGYKEYDFIDSIQINADATGGTATVTYNVDKMFSMASGSPVQNVSSVTHYSKFSLSKNLTYSLQYTFNTRYYGTKLYKYTNVKFTEQELRSYFLNQITDPNCDHIKLDKQFVKAKAPFESNFREDLTWVVDNVTFNNVNDPTIGYLTATQIPVTWANATVFDIDNNGEISTTKMAAPIEKLFKASVHDKPDHSNIADPEARKAAELADITGWAISDNDEMYHPIRTSYTDGGTTTPLYIHHWDIYQLDSFTYSTTEFAPDGFNLKVDDKSKLVAQAYSSRFNYVGYEDYAIVPVYSTENVDRQALSDNRTDSSATLLTLTRNQWNANVAGNTKGGSYINSADRVYVDFMLNYNYSVKINGKDTNILLNSTGDNIKVGFIVRSYTWENEDKHYSKAQYVLVDKAQINDKNRMEYCFGFNNTANNRKAGLYYEFKPFIVDTSNQAGSAGCDVTISGETYKALYADSTVSVLDQVSFYQLGRL